MVTATFAVRSSTRVTSTVVEAGFILVNLQPKRSNSWRLSRRYGYEANGLQASMPCVFIIISCPRFPASAGWCHAGMRSA